MGAIYDLKSFKHDGSSHRLWCSLTLIKEDDDYYYLASPRTKVIEDDGREWKTQQPTLYILSKREFFNVICMIKGYQIIDYYVNIASPTILEGDTFCFIDYDLDLKKSNGEIKELDINEYQQHAKLYNYSEKLMTIITTTFEKLNDDLKKGNRPFTDMSNLKLYQSFYETYKLKKSFF